MNLLYIVIIQLLHGYWIIPDKLVKLDVGLRNTFKFNIKHIKGSDNPEADALSCLFEVEEYSQITNQCNFLQTILQVFTDILEHQDNDPELKAIKDRIAQWSQVQNYIVSKNTLLLKANKEIKPKVVVPRSLVTMFNE